MIETEGAFGFNKLVNDSHDRQEAQRSQEYKK